MKEKFKTSKFNFTINITICILIVFKFIAMYLESYDYYFRLRYTVITINILILTLVMIKPIRHRGVLFIVRGMAIVLICIGILLATFKSEDILFTFKSPNGRNTIVVEECTFLLGGWSNIYVIKNGLFMKKIENHVMTTDDGYRPFSNDDYSVSWDGDYLMIIYGYGSNNIDKSFSRKIE